MKHHGQCHCGAIKFVFEHPAEVSMTNCNCSMCRMTGYQHIFIPQSDFHVTHEPEHLTTYTFNTHAAKHMFCSVCGIKAFYIPRSHPNCYSVNLRCIQPGTLTITHVIDFDGGDWEANVEALRKET